MTQTTFKEYLENRLGDNSNSVRQYCLIRDVFEREGHSLNDDGVETFLARKGKRGGSRRKHIYRAFLFHYFKYHKLPNIEIPKERRRGASSITIPKFLPYNQINYLIVKLPGIMGLMVKIYFETGLRLNELIEAKKKDFNVKKRTVIGIGKGNKPFKVRYSQNTANVLSEWLATMNFDDFPFKYGNVKNHDKKFWYDLKKESLKLGIPDVHPHRFRHGLAYYLRTVKKFDLEQIRVKMRHTKLDTVQIYAAATQDEVDDKMDNEVFGNEKV